MNNGGAVALLSFAVGVRMRTVATPGTAQLRTLLSYSKGEIAPAGGASSLRESGWLSARAL